MERTPNSQRLHITLLGRRNSGKSSLINAITGQPTAIVSPIAGTTTDPVSKAMEIYPLGACLLIDTPGFDDTGELGTLRVERTLEALERTDIALLLCEGDAIDFEWKQQLEARGIPLLLLLNKVDARPHVAETLQQIEELCGETALPVSAKERSGIKELLHAIEAKLPEEFGARTITGNLVHEGDLVLLVMPQDIQAPKGRLILPQVQVLRELLDKKCSVMSCTTDRLAHTLQQLSLPPRLIITDSQVFRTVYDRKPEGSMLTSFSVLFAAYKGDIRYYLEGASHIAALTEQSRVLIAEACTHVPLKEDIGRVKLPRLLRQRIGEQLQIDVVSGNDFPADLSKYDLIIQCGACMFNRRYVLSRTEQAKLQQIPMTNYGIAIAYLNGILSEVVVGE
jgi:[FeFe] hydrogenase H-cluster maturation GTPase HydF